MSKISISFTSQEWQYILNTLAARPYGEVSPLIISLQQQFATATKPEVETSVDPDPAS